MSWEKEHYKIAMRMARYYETLNKAKFDDIDEEIKSNEEFAKLMATPIDELPDSYRFSFDGNDWSAFIKNEEDVSYYNFIRYLTGYYKDIELLVSKTYKLIGWLTYKVMQETMCNLKFGSFSKDPNDNKQLLFDIKEFITKLLKQYHTIVWMADKRNTKVVKYYDRLDKIIPGDTKVFKIEEEGDSTTLHYALINNYSEWIRQNSL